MIRFLLCVLVAIQLTPPMDYDEVVERRRREYWGMLLGKDWFKKHEQDATRPIAKVQPSTARSTQKSFRVLVTTVTYVGSHQQIMKFETSKAADECVHKCVAHVNAPEIGYRHKVEYHALRMD